jgi:hypothetical protein
MVKTINEDEIDIKLIDFGALIKCKDLDDEKKPEMSYSCF